MKKKRPVLTAATLLLILALLLGGLPLFSHLYYHRSTAATLFAWQLKKDVYSIEYAFQEYLLEKGLENAETYVIPEGSAPDIPARVQWSGSMKYYIMNHSEHPDKLIVYFPGGSYIDQPRPVHWQFLSDVGERTGAMIAVPIYPKLPDADAEASYEAVRKFFDELTKKYDCGELIFMGDSAGGGMALSLAMQLRDDRADGPDKLILICPWVDVTMSNPEISVYEKKDPALDSRQLARLGDLWAGDLEETDPVASPLYGRFDGLGRITLITGTGELLYPDIMLLDSALTDAGIDHDTIVSSGMFHVWPLYHRYSIPEAEETFEDIITAVERAPG